MAIAQLDYTLQFVSGINCNGKDESAVMRMVVQYGKEAVCYLKDQSFAQHCATRISQVTGLTFNIAKLTQDKNIAYCLIANGNGDYKSNKGTAQELNKKHADQLMSELFGNNPSQLLYIFPEKSK